MRKRLRKKKHRGEFTVYGAHCVIRFDRASRDLDAFLDVVVEAVEANHCFTAAGGRIQGDVLDAFIELGMKSEKPSELLVAIRAWVANQPDILAHRFSPVTDAWHGPVYDFDAEMNLVGKIM